MALSLKDLFEAYNVKIAEKINALDTKIGTNTGTGGGVSADLGNNITLGSDQKPYFKQRTPAEIATAYESNADTNKFTDAYKLTLDGLGAQLSSKADLDPATGKVVTSQLPNLRIANVISATETSFSAFLPNSINYTFGIGDVINIVDTFGNIENYLYLGGDSTLATSYVAINEGQVKFYPAETDKPVPGATGFLHVVTGTKAVYLWDPSVPDYVSIAGGSSTPDKYFMHDQGVAAATWTVTHNLNKYPAVTVHDSSGREVEGEISHTNLNSLTINFNAGFSGRATCN